MPVRQSVMFVILAAALAACGGDAPGDEGNAGGGGQINGAGATFPYPLYSNWFAEYHKLRPDVRINYQSLGSGAGIRS